MATDQLPPPKEPDGPAARRWIDGRQALLHHDVPAAEEAFTEALGLAGDDDGLKVELFRGLARVCELDGRFAQADDLRRAADELATRLQPSLTSDRLRALVDALRAQDPNSDDLAGLLARLAARERFEGRLTAAIAHLEEALAIAERRDPQALQTARWGGNLALLRILAGDDETAVADAEQVLDRLRADDPRGASVVLRSIAQVRTRAGDIERADRDAREAIELARAAGAQTEHAAAVSALGFVRQAAGDPEGAAKLYREAVELAGDDPEALVPAAVNLVRLSVAERAHGDLDAAIATAVSAADALAAGAPQSEERAEATYHLAELRHQQGALGEAAAAYRLVAELTKSPTRRVECEIGIGTIEKERRRLDDAERRLTAALAAAEDIGDPELIADAMNALAGAHRWSGNFAEAIRLYEAVLELSNPADPSRSAPLANLGGVYYQQGDYVRAAEQYRASLEIAEAAGRPSEELAQSRYNLATALQGLGDFRAADELLKRLSTELRGRLLAEVHGRRGEIAYHQGRVDDAVEHLRAAVAVAEQARAGAGDPLTRSDVYAAMQHLYQGLLRSLHRRARPEDAEEALGIAELSRARTLEDRLAAAPTGEGAPTSRAEEHALRAQLAAIYRRQLRARSSPETPTVTDELARQERDLRARLADVSQPLPGGVAERALTGAEIRAALAPDTALVEFQVVGDDVFAWVVTSDGTSLDVLARRHSEIVELVVAVVGPYQAGEPGGAETAAAWDALRDLLVGPLAGRMGDARTVLVSPAGALFFIPLEVLLDETRVVYVPSATIALRERSPRAALPRDAEFAGFGDPAFDRALPEFAALPKLPGARIEVAEIAELFDGDAHVFCEREATEAELRSWARRCRYLHIAAHGLVDLENPMRSGLVLASPAGVPMLDRPGLDDILHADEILGLEVGADLVVCAACRTGFGDIRAGEGLASIGSALLQAGSPWVLVSLWPVGDLVTISFMTALYEALRRGEEVSAAVHAARREIRADHDDPFWWAPFVLYGTRT